MMRETLFGPVLVFDGSGGIGGGSNGGIDGGGSGDVVVLVVRRS